MDISNAIGDQDAQKNGVERDYQDGVKVMIAFAGSQPYRNYLAQQLTLARRANRNRDLDPDVVNEITVKAMARHIVKGWTPGGFTVGDQPFEFSEANAEQLLKQSVHFRDFVSDEANDGATFGIFKAKEGEESAAVADTKSGPAVEPKVGA